MAEKLILKNIRIAFPRIWKAEGFEGQAPKFSVVGLIDKNDPQVKTLNEKINEVAKEKFPKLMKGNTWPKALNHPLMDGDEKAEQYPAFEGMYRFNAKANADRKLAIVSPKREIYKEEECPIESGSYVNLAVAIAGYDNMAKGVGLYLNGVQFVKAGELIGGGFNIDEFDELEEDEDGYDFM